MEHPPAGQFGGRLQSTLAQPAGAAAAAPGGGVGLSHQRQLPFQTRRPQRHGHCRRAIRWGNGRHSAYRTGELFRLSSGYADGEGDEKLDKAHGLCHQGRRGRLPICRKLRGKYRKRFGQNYRNKLVCSSPDTAQTNVRRHESECYQIS